MRCGATASPLQLNQTRRARRSFAGGLVVAGMCLDRIIPPVQWKWCASPSRPLLRAPRRPRPPPHRPARTLAGRARARLETRPRRSKADSEATKTARTATWKAAKRPQNALALIWGDRQRGRRSGHAGVDRRNVPLRSTQDWSGGIASESVDDRVVPQAAIVTRREP